MNHNLTEEEEQIIESIAEEFDKYPFDLYTGLQVAEIIRGNLKW